MNGCLDDPNRSPDLHAIDACGGSWIVAILPPGRMRKMNDGVAVVRDDGVVKHQCADSPPVPKTAAHAKRCARCDPVIGDFDRERERPLRRRIAHLPLW